MIYGGGDWGGEGVQFLYEKGLFLTTESTEDTGVEVVNNNFTL